MTNFALLEHQQSHRWRLLRHLGLSDNGLTTITRPSLNPLTSTLQSLDLSSNLFTEIPEALASLVHLRALNLSNCMIESLQLLAKSPLPAISVLNLRGNRISSLAGIEKLLSLERLDLRENKLRDPTELARLTGMPDFHDVYVSRNPFTKTHANYRVTIFNLFRQSPGYSEDVIVDATPPGYSERRQLVDRVPEPTNVPVIRAPLEDDMPPPPKPEQATAAAQTSVAGIFEVANPVYDSQSQRRRKGTRRRIVDIAQNEPSKRPSMDETADSSFLTSAPVSDRRTNTLSEFAKDPRLELHAPALSPIPQSPDPHSTSTVVEDEEERAELTLSSEQYRQRIEALKNDLGSNWLSALGDDGWQREKDTSPIPQSPMISPPLMSPPLISGANTPVLTSSRRLG
jgi:Leucine-rich repeat (LRR) protein